MGTGNRLNPFLFEITDISKTSVCPLAKTMRYELKKRNIHHVPVLYSKEVPSRHILTNEFGKHIPGSISFVPAVAGMCIALRLSQPLKAEFPILVKVSGRLIEASDVHWEKALSPMVETDVGTVKVAKLEQP